LECAGNGRRFLEPPAPGEPWGLGAVATAEWSGVLLSDLLDDAGVDSGVIEILVTGADSGFVPELGRAIPFERSLPIADAGSAIVAHSMNGQPLPPDHGAPLRLMVGSSTRFAVTRGLVAVRSNASGQERVGLRQQRCAARQG